MKIKSLASWIGHVILIERQGNDDNNNCGCGEMADTLSSGGSGATRVRSNRIIRTILKMIQPETACFFCWQKHCLASAGVIV